MNPNISEFSDGYALTESLINTVPLAILAASVFPSLIEEGKVGGGYDLQIPFEGFPLFLQFKLSHKMIRDTAFEAQIGRLKCSSSDLIRQAVSDQLWSAIPLKVSNM